MEKLREIGMAYYRAAPPDLQNKISDLFRSIAVEGKDKIKLPEFLAFTSKEPGFERMNNGYFFKELNRDQTGRLDFNDIVTLFYILKSGRPFCDGCQMLVPELYFTCVQCFECEGDAIYLCLECFKDPKNRKKRESCKNSDRGPHKFFDNFALLEAMRNNSVSKARHPNPVPSTPRRHQSKDPRPKEIVVTIPSADSVAIVVRNPHSKGPRSKETVVTNQSPDSKAIVVRNPHSKFRALAWAMNALFIVCTVARRVAFGI